MRPSQFAVVSTVHHSVYYLQRTFKRRGRDVFAVQQLDEIDARQSQITRVADERDDSAKSGEQLVNALKMFSILFFYFIRWKITTRQGSSFTPLLDAGASGLLILLDTSYARMCCD